MNIVYRLIVAVWFLLGCAVVNASVAPIPKEKPVIKCVVTVTGKFETVFDGRVVRRLQPDAGQVAVTNISNESVDLESILGPCGSLDVKPRDPKGVPVKTDPLWSLLSPRSSQPQPHLLKPGETEKFPVSLLVMLPKDKRVAGTYMVKAVYTLNKKDYESAEVEVKWPGEN